MFPFFFYGQTVETNLINYFPSKKERKKMSKKVQVITV